MKPRERALAKLRRLVETPRKAELWGVEYMITPRFVGEMLGDGQRLIGFQPLNTRPNYYVVAVDSGWDLDGFEPDDWPDWVMDAIGDEYGDRNRCDCDDEGSSREDAKHAPDCWRNRGFPVLSADSGWTSWDRQWPKAFTGWDRAALRSGKREAP